MFVDGIKLRPANGEEVKQDPQDQATIVEPEGPEPKLLTEGGTIGMDVSQAELDKSDRQLTERPEGANRAR